MKVAFYTYNKKTYSELLGYIRSLNIKLISLPTKVRRLALLKSPSRYKKHFQHISETQYRGIFYTTEINRINLSNFPNLFINIK